MIIRFLAFAAVILLAGNTCARAAALGTAAHKPTPSAADAYAHCPEGLVFVHRGGPFYTFVVGAHQVTNASFELDITSATARLHYRVYELDLDGVAKIGQADWRIAKAIRVLFPNPDPITSVTITPAQAACYPTRLPIPYGTAAEESLHDRIDRTIERSSFALLPDDPQPSAEPHACVDTDVTVVRAITPDYPDIARMQGASGRTRVIVRVDETGRVLRAMVYRSSGNAVLDNAAIVAARTSTYAPATHGCVPVAADYYATESFGVANYGAPTY